MLQTSVFVALGKELGALHTQGWAPVSWLCALLPFARTCFYGCTGFEHCSKFSIISSAEGRLGLPESFFFFLFSLCSEGREVSSRNTQAFPMAPCPRRLSYIRFSQPCLAIGGQAVVDRSPQQGPSQALVVVWREPLCSWCSHWSLRSCDQP